MNILISGASGLIGRALMQYLPSCGHTVYQLQRHSNNSPFYWSPQSGTVQLDDSIAIDGVINLNGVNIGDKNWSPSRKQAIIDSRINSTELLAKTLANMTQKPKVLINASAIGYYGDTGNTLVDEQHDAGHNFLSDIVRPWEAAAQPAIDAGIRTVFMRSGVVLSAQGGALAKMLLPFKLCLGGKIGAGQQYMSWISLLDEVRAIDFLLTQTDIHGPVNLTAPNPVTNHEFTQALGQSLKRPTPFPMPEFIVKTLFGEMGELLLLGSARVQPNVLLHAGFEFSHPTLSTALQYCQTENSY